MYSSDNYLLIAGPGILTDSFADLIGLETGAAKLNAFDSTINLGTNLVQIGVETTLRSIESVASIVAHLGAFSAYIAYS